MASHIVRAVTKSGELELLETNTRREAHAIANASERKARSAGAMVEVYAKSCTVGALRVFLATLPADMDDWPVEWEAAGFAGSVDSEDIDVDHESKTIQIVTA
ncbi:hypothetical protein AB0P37_08525 [Streptomyces antimycoticus]|uniref:hypothetical protein n=1 Tax=Streptomyces antimycoticus TaxID=68175 RepID=UPI00341D211A